MPTVMMLVFPDLLCIGYVVIMTALCVYDHDDVSAQWYAVAVAVRESCYASCNRKSLMP